MTPKVSIIVPVYKVEAYLYRCVDSILAQTFKDFELILVDDGSPDKSGEICEEYAIKDNRVRVFHKINGGVSSARNLALDNAIGDFIMFVDSDDWIASDCIELCVKEIHEKDLDALQFGFAMVWDDRMIYKIKNATDILCGDKYVRSNNFNVSSWGGIYRTGIIRFHNLRFNESIKYAEDQLFILSFLKNAERIMYKEVVLYYYYQNPESAVHNYQSNDILLSCEELIKFSKDWPITKKHVDNMIVGFVINIIQNNDIPYRFIEAIYKKQNVQMNPSLTGISRVFYYLSKLNFTIACCFTFIYLKLRLSFYNKY